MPLASQDPFRWDALLQTLRSEHPALYRAWFDDLSPGQLIGGQLCVYVPDAAWRDYLAQQCAQAFADIAMAMTGHLISVSFSGPESYGRSLDGAPCAKRLTRMSLNPDYTFSEFVVGPSNRLAHAACKAICAQLGSLYNPLFLHGASGLGKTHLLQAVCADLLRENSALDVVYVSCETFVNDFIQAIETGGLAAFRESARRTNLLVIDDVQFLASRESSQEEFFHTFNVLYQDRHQLVLSADSPPTEIPTLQDRLVSRFNWGLVAQIDPPDRETRQAILQKKAHLRSCEIAPDILDYIAEHVESNIRTLEGALTRFITECQVNAKPPTLETAREIITGFASPCRRPLQVSDILQAVSSHFSIRLQELLGRRRTRSISHPRHIAMYLARKLTPLSLEEIGMQFDGRDHSTILHAERTVETECQRNPHTAEVVSTLTRNLLARS